MASRKRSQRGTGRSKDDSTALKVRFRGRDNAPLTMAEMAEGLLELIRELKKYEKDYRAKFATIYLTVIDENGEAVRINEANELTIYPYRTAADEHGV